MAANLPSNNGFAQDLIQLVQLVQSGLMWLIADPQDLVQLVQLGGWVEGEGRGGEFAQDLIQLVQLGLMWLIAGPPGLGSISSIRYMCEPPAFVCKPRLIHRAILNAIQTASYRHTHQVHGLRRDRVQFL